MGTDRKFNLRSHFQIVIFLCEVFLGGTQRKRVTSSYVTYAVRCFKCDIN